MLLPFILEDSKDTVQALGNTTSDASSDLSKIKAEIFSHYRDDRRGLSCRDGGVTK
jgi:hypothetical protein